MAFSTSYIVNPEIAAKITNKDELYAQEYISGNSNTTHAFGSVMHGFVISNDGQESLTFEINGYEFEVKSGEVFENVFRPFMSVAIKTNGAFRAFGKGEHGIQAEDSEHTIFPTGKIGLVSSSGKFKSSCFQVMSDRDIKFIGASGSPSKFQIWEMEPYKKGASNTRILSSQPLATGTFSETRDSDGYLIANLNEPLPVGIGKHYALIAEYTTTETIKYLSYSTETGNIDSVLRATGYSQSSEINSFGKGMIYSKLFYYDFKIGVEI